MLLSFKVGKNQNIRVENLEELNEKISSLNKSLKVKDVKIDGNKMCEFDGISLEQFSVKIKDTVEKYRTYLVITLHDNDFWDLLESLGEHLSTLYNYYSDDYFKEYLFSEYPLEELKKYSLEYLQNLYKLKRFLSETPEKIEKISKYFEENLDVYFMKESEVMSIFVNHEYLVIALFEDSGYEKGYKLL